MNLYEGVLIAKLILFENGTTCEEEDLLPTFPPPFLPRLLPAELDDEAEEAEVSTVVPFEFEELLFEAEEFDRVGEAEDNLWR